MDNRRPLWPVVTAALVLLPVVYVLSFGPASWIVARQVKAGSPSGFHNAAIKFYAPLFRICRARGEDWLLHLARCFDPDEALWSDCIIDEVRRRAAELDYVSVHNLNAPESCFPNE